nr:hypothetical protein [uncultured Campylobacter sp.]
MANSFKNSYFYIGYIRRVFLSLLLCFSFGLTDEFNATLIENWQKANEILDTLKISKKQKEDILNSIKALKENENELKEFETLSLCVKNGDIKCAEKSIEKYPKLLSYKIFPYGSLLTATLKAKNIKLDKTYGHITKVDFDFDEKMFDFLVSKGHRIYGDDDMFPFLLLLNEAVSDEKCLEIIKKMRDDGMDLGIKMPYNENVGLEIEALSNKKSKTFDFLSKNNKSLNANSLYTIISIHFVAFFNENNAKITKSFADENAKKLAKTQKYKDFIQKEMELLSIYIKNYGKINKKSLSKNAIKIEEFLKLIDDKENYEKITNLLY